jgi:uncharacterized protein
MTREFTARRLDVRAFAEDGGVLSGTSAAGEHSRLMAETEGRGAASPVAWVASGELRDPLHVQPQIWLHLKAHASLPLTCQRCLSPVEVHVSVDRLFRFVADEEMAAAQDEQSEEDVLALNRSFDLVELVEDELLMELPLAPRHATCPPVRLGLADEDFTDAARPRDNPFAVLGKLKEGKQ